MWKLCAAVVAIWAAVSFGTFAMVPTLSTKLPTTELSRSGTFGDTFGAVNSLFSALGVAGVAYALILQYREQHADRLKASQAWTAAEADRKHAAGLAMLAARIHGTAALLQSYQSRYEVHVRNFQEAKLTLQGQFGPLKPEKQTLELSAQALIDIETKLTDLMTLAESKGGEN